MGSSDGPQITWLAYALAGRALQLLTAWCRTSCQTGAHEGLSSPNRQAEFTLITHTPITLSIQGRRAVLMYNGLRWPCREGSDGRRAARSCHWEQHAPRLPATCRASQQASTLAPAPASNHGLLLHPGEARAAAAYQSNRGGRRTPLNHGRAPHTGEPCRLVGFDRLAGPLQVLIGSRIMPPSLSAECSDSAAAAGFRAVKTAGPGAAANTVLPGKGKRGQHTRTGLSTPPVTIPGDGTSSLHANASDHGHTTGTSHCATHAAAPWYPHLMT